MNIQFSFIDVFIIVVLLWATYKGIKRGPVVHALSLLVIIVGIALFGLMSESIADFIRDRATVRLENLHQIIFIILFSATIWLSNLIANKIEAAGTNTKGFANISLGILTSIIKYIFLLSIFLLFFDKIDTGYDLLSSTEKNKTIMYKPIKNIAPSTIKTISFLKD